MKDKESNYDRNEAVNIVEIEELDEKNEVYLMSFFRRIELLHVYWERVLPTFKQGESLIVAAMKTRPWPPWGSGSQRIIAMCHAYPKDKVGVYLSATWVGKENLTNIGLMSAINKEMLERLMKRGKTNVNFVVQEGSIWAHRVLMTTGFEKTDEPYLTEDSRYAIYRSDTGKLLEHLRLSIVSSEELLAHKMNDDTFDRMALFNGMMQLATRAQPHEVLAKPNGGVPNGGRS